MKNYHLIKEDEKWKPKKESAERSSKNFETKQEAIQQCAEYLKTHGGGSL